MQNTENAFEIKIPATQNNSLYKTDDYIKNLMGTANQKTKIYTHIKKKKQSKHNTKDNLSSNHK